MLLKGVWDFLEETVFPFPSTEILFNPYWGRDSNYDLTGAAEIRRENLRRYLSSFQERPEILVVGEAPGPRGCRFSGVPFTSEAQLCGGDLPFSGRQSSLGPSPWAETSATIVWKALRAHHPKFFLWNCVPFHPHRHGLPLSIRPPNRHEVDSCASMLRQMQRLIAPQAVVAVGRSAERALAAIDVPCCYVRHPAHGGADRFTTGIRRVLDETPTA